MKTTLFLLFSALLIPSLSSADGPPPAKEQIAATLLAPPRTGAPSRRAGIQPAGQARHPSRGHERFDLSGRRPEEGKVQRRFATTKISNPSWRADANSSPRALPDRSATTSAGRRSATEPWPCRGPPRALYVLNGTAYDAAAGKVTAAYLRWVLYVPYATPETTGLSTERSPSAPWLMGSGTAGAHIMINRRGPRSRRPDALARRPRRAGSRARFSGEDTQAPGRVAPGRLRNHAATRHRAPAETRSSGAWHNAESASP